MTAGARYSAIVPSGTGAGHSAVTGLRHVRATVADACDAAGRDATSVTLLAASKTVSAEVLQQVLQAGQVVFGENRVQEAAAKWPALREQQPALDLHLVGPLQSNKVRDAVAVFDAIHSVDRPSLCRALAREFDRAARRPALYVQVNTGDEEQKSGIGVAGVDAFLLACRSEYQLDVRGLMCVPPAGEPPEPHFRLLARIAERNGLAGLSMGMSGDFAAAIACGATHVRVGSAIFGARPPVSVRSTG